MNDLERFTKELRKLWETVLLEKAVCFLYGASAGLGLAALVALALLVCKLLSS